MVECGTRSPTRPRSRFRTSSSTSSLVNMIPFFDELTRVVRGGGYLLVFATQGARTPIYVPPQRLRAELGRRGFEQFAEFGVRAGTALLSRKSDRTEAVH